MNYKAEMHQYNDRQTGFKDGMEVYYKRVIEWMATQVHSDLRTA
jgi:hypothetical protein